MYKIRNVQNWKCTTTLLPDVQKLEMYKIWDVQTGDVQKLKMYKHSATGCTNYIESDVQKIVFVETYQHGI